MRTGQMARSRTRSCLARFACCRRNDCSYREIRQSILAVAPVERPGELVGKEELMARVWPKIFFGPANLTVHIARLRRALG
jgi:DNA-binding response OmpR family regulator